MCRRCESRTVATTVFFGAVVRHEKARAIFLDPGEARPGELIALKDALATGGLDGELHPSGVAQEIYISACFANKLFLHTER